MENEQIREHIEKVVNERRKNRAPDRTRAIGAKRQDLTTRGLGNSSEVPNMLLWDQIKEARAVIADYLAVGVDSYWKARGEVPRSERDWLLSRCAAVASGWVDQTISIDLTLDAQTWFGTYQREVPKPDAVRAQLDVLAGERQLDDMNRSRQAPLYDHWWWQGIVLFISLAGVVIALLALLLEK